MPTKFKKVTGVATIVAALAIAGPAYAGPTGVASQDAYGGGGAVLGQSTNPSTGNVAGTSVAKATAPTEAKGIGSLPFTGLDVLALVGGGLVLVLVGMSVRQLARRPV